jgi:hypothetical protein
MMKQARIGANGSIIGFSMTTAAVQPVAITNAMLKVGVGPVMKSLKQYILHGGESIDYAMENSQELPQRMRNRDREVAELMSKLKRDGGLLSDAQQWGYYMIARTDMYTAAMSWQAAVTYGMNELPSPSTKSMGMTEEEAQQYGDSVLAQTQGAGAAKDMSRLQSYPSEMVKSLTVFYTYWGAMFDLNERLIRDAWQFKKEPLSRIKWVNMMFWWGVVVPAITDWILGRDDDCGDEPLAGCVAKNLFWSGLGNYASMLPGGNQLVRAIKSERQVRGFELGTGQRVVTEAFTGLAAGAGVLAPPDNATRAEQALEFAEHMGKAVWMYKGMPGLVQADRLRKTLVMMHNEEDITWRRPLFGRQ